MRDEDERIMKDSITESSSTRESVDGRAKIRTWAKRLGFWGVMFFLLKGLLWLAIPTLIAFFATD
jgi:hypothetical protein